MSVFSTNRKFPEIINRRVTKHTANKRATDQQIFQWNDVSVVPHIKNFLVLTQHKRTHFPLYPNTFAIPNPHRSSFGAVRSTVRGTMAEDKYNRKNPAVKRILQEVKEMQSNPSDDFMSLPLEVPILFLERQFWDLVNLVILCAEFLFFDWERLISLRREI